MARDNEREGRRLLALAQRYAAGEAGEKLVAAALAPLLALGWTLLEDRRWSATSEANIDLIVVGPGGVVVVDAKNWRVSPRLVDGVLMHAGTVCSADTDRLVAATRLVEASVAPLGVSPVAVTAMMAFAGRRLNQSMRGLRMVGAYNAAGEIASLPIRFTAAVVREVAAHLAVAFPQHTNEVAHPTGDHNGPGAEPLSLFDVHRLLEAHERAARSGLIEDWMTYLSPAQHDLVRRTFGGPARISGPAGTGKSVVGMHRAAHIAQRGAGTVLFVTFVKSLANVQRNLIRRLAPAVGRRVDVRTVHAIATLVLARHGCPPKVDPAAIRGCFDAAWARVGRTALCHIDPRPGYWRDEIQYVIKGRGFTTLEEYRVPERHGRRTRLHGAQREAVWRLHTEYENLRRDRGLHDFADVLLLALDSVRRHPMDNSYDAVIIDEAQDLTLTALRFLHALVGDKPDGLLLIGDAQQAVYPGGYRLADAGIQIRGARSNILRVNYRNSRRVLAAAERLIAGATVEDIDGDTAAGNDGVELTGNDGHVTDLVMSSTGELDRTLLAALTTLDEPGAAAVLCAENDAVGRYQALLRRAGLPVQNLEDYDGTPTNAIKVGTFVRGKGLDFKHVFLPHYDRAIRGARTGGGADADRVEQATNQLYVAMIRARDTLWLATLTHGGMRDH